MKVSIVCTAPKKPDIVSRAIMWWTGTDFSHCFFLYQGMIYHADRKGVNQVKLSSYLVTHVIRRSFDEELQTTEEIFEAFMAGENGKDYAESQFLGFIFTGLQKLVGNGDKKRICSELIAVVLERFAGFTWEKDKDFLSPADIAKKLERKKINALIFKQL